MEDKFEECVNQDVCRKYTDADIKGDCPFGKECDGYKSVYENGKRGSDWDFIWTPDKGKFRF